MDSKSKSCGVESAGKREGEENGINRNRQIDTGIPLRESNRWRRAREDNADRAEEGSERERQGGEGGRRRTAWAIRENAQRDTTLLQM